MLKPAARAEARQIVLSRGESRPAAGHVPVGAARGDPQAVMPPEDSVIDLGGGDPCCIDAFAERGARMSDRRVGRHVRLEGWIVLSENRKGGGHRRFLFVLKRAVEGIVAEQHRLRGESNRVPL